MQNKITFEAMKKELYIAPATSNVEIDLCGFICQSIKTTMFKLEVDEYSNCGEEVLEF